MTLIKVHHETWTVFNKDGCRLIKPPYYDWKFQRSWYRVSNFVKECFLKRCFIENFFANRDPCPSVVKQKIANQTSNARHSLIRVRPDIKYRKKQLE